VKVRLTSTNSAGPAGIVGNGWWNGNAPSNNYVKYVVAGSTLTVSYTVTDSSDAAVAGATVNLAVAKGGAGVANFTGSLSATTDANGVATFNLVNTNTDEDSESFRADLTAWSDVTAGTKEYKADFTPSVTGATATIADLLWTHTVRSAAPAPAPTETATAAPSESATATETPTTPAGPWTIRSTTFTASQGQPAAGWVANGWYHAGLGYGETHVAAGSSTVMSYHVAAANGVTAAGVSVKLILGKAWSGSNAHVSVGGVTASGAEAWNGNISLANANCCLFQCALTRERSLEQGGLSVDERPVVCSNSFASKRL
jgi:hypothetical protein